MSDDPMPGWAQALADRLEVLVTAVDRNTRVLERVETKADRTAEEVRNLSVRMSSLEALVGHIAVGIGALNGRLDGFETRLVLIERRLELRDGRSA
jgi:hypothetical protein